MVEIEQLECERAIEIAKLDALIADREIRVAFIGELNASIDARLASMTKHEMLDGYIELEIEFKKLEEEHEASLQSCIGWKSLTLTFLGNYLGGKEMGEILLSLEPLTKKN